MQHQQPTVEGERNAEMQQLVGSQLVVPNFVQKPSKERKVMEPNGVETVPVSVPVTKRGDKVLYKSPLQQRRCEGITLTTASSKKSSTENRRGSGK